MQFHKDLKVFEELKVSLKWLFESWKIDRIQCRHVCIIGILPYRHIQCRQQHLAVITREAIERIVGLGCMEGIQSSTGKFHRQIVACDDVWKDGVVEAKYMDCEPANRGWIGSRRNDTTRDVIWPLDKSF